MSLLCDLVWHDMLTCQNAAHDVYHNWTSCKRPDFHIIASAVRSRSDRGTNTVHSTVHSFASLVTCFILVLTFKPKIITFVCWLSWSICILLQLTWGNIVSFMRCIVCTCCCSRTGSIAEVFYWDATALPLKDNSVDVFVTDMVKLPVFISFLRYTNGKQCLK